MKKLKIFSLSAFCSLSLFSCSFFNNLFSNGNGNGRLDQPSLAEIVLDVREKNPIHTALNNLPTEDRKNFEQYFKDSCISNNFAQGQDENLYGIHCLKNNRLSIKTSKDGTKVAVSSALKTVESTKKEGEQETEDERQFITVNTDLNKEIYKTGYQILETEDLKLNPLLGKLLDPTRTSKEEFTGMRNTEYQILFDFRDDWLILYKASEREELIPFTERSSEEPTLKAAGLYAVPFIGYGVQYCDVTQQEVNGEKTNEYIKTNCNGRLKKVGTNEDKPYVQIIGTQQVYQYVPKLNLFPSDYFDGKWFFTQAVVKSPSPTSEMLYIDNAYLVEASKSKNSIEFIDQSGNIEDASKGIKFEMPVIWKGYVSKTEGSYFAEEEITDDIKILETVNEENDTGVLVPYVQVNFDKYTAMGMKFKNLIISDNFFSYVLEYNLPPDPKRGRLKTTKEQLKISFLRESALDKFGFNEKRWFKEDHEKHFGILPATTSQRMPDMLDNDQSKYQHWKQFQFNINGKSQEIKWYFSKSSTPDKFYRDIAREAVGIYNQAFQYISKEKIKVTLVEGQDKDLGDIRYNLINLIDRQASPFGGLFGVAPSFSNPDTGQTIGSVANVAIHTTVDQFDLKVKNYIQYEIFRFHKHKPTDWQNELHAVSPYLKSQIENQCRGDDKSKRGEILSFIDEHITLREQGKITPRSPLGKGLGYSEDKVKELISNCSKKISRNYVLMLLLHEIGHNFGLAHNFNASADKKNYWKSKDEISKVFKDLSSLSIILDENTHLSDNERLPKSSSVMDYLPLDVLPLTYLGKYDIAGLRYLYMNQLEDKDEKPFEITNFSTSLDTQISEGEIPSKILQKYLYCSDLLEKQWKEDKKNLFCMKFDYGSSPYDKIQFVIEDARRILYNTGRYYYDKSFSNPNIGHLQVATHVLFFIKPLYNRWISLKNRYLNDTKISRYEMSDYQYKTSDTCSVEEENKPIDESHKNPSVIRYLEAIERGFYNSDKLEEYQAFYAIREPIANFLMELLFLEPMKCKVKPLSEEGSEEGDHQWVELEMVRKYLTNPKSDRWAELQSQYAHLSSEEKPFIYIEDCYSPAVKDFFKLQDLEVIGQLGLENFSSFYPGDYVEGEAKDDVVSLEFFVKTDLKSSISHINEMLNEEPNFFEDFRLKTEKYLLESVNRIHLGGSLLNIYSKMKNLLDITDESDSRDAEIRERNLNYFRSSWFNSDFFESDILNTIKDYGIEVSQIESPFIRTSYQDFITENNYPNTCLTEPANPTICHLNEFETEIKKLNTSMKEGLNSLDQFIIPFERDNFVEQMIKMYNCKWREKKELEGIESQGTRLSDLQRIQRDKLNLHMEILKTSITNSEPDRKKKEILKQTQ